MSSLIRNSLRSLFSDNRFIWAFYAFGTITLGLSAWALQSFNFGKTTVFWAVFFVALATVVVFLITTLVTYAADRRRHAETHPLAGLWPGMLELLSHSVIVLGILGAIRAMEILVDRLLGNGLLLFDRIPLSRLFDAADLVLLVSFSTVGVFVILRAYFQK